MNNPYTELIEKVEESFQALARTNAARDARRERLEKKKVLLLALLLASAWIILFLLSDRMDGSFWTAPEPPHEYQPQPHYQIHEDGEPIYAI
jgi:hypothetical protein